MEYILYKHIILSLFIILTFVLSISSSEAGKYTADFLTTGVGARALAMGGAFTALADDATASYWNPAGLTQLERREISLMHSSMFDDIVRTDFINFVYPMTYRNSALAIGILRLGVDDIPITTRLDNNQRPIIDKYVNDSEYAIYLSYAHLLNSNVSLGGNIKTIRQSVGDNSSLGYGIDLSLHYQMFSQLSFGITLSDITGTIVTWDTGHRDIRHPSMRSAIAYHRIVPSLNGTITATVDMEASLETNSLNAQIGNETFGMKLHYGLEYWIRDTIALRGGLNDEWSAGAGFKVSFFNIDYAFCGYELGNTHRVSMGVKL